MAIGSYQSEEVREKLSKVRTGEQSTRRPDAVILAEPSLQKLSPFNCQPLDLLHR